MDAIVVEGYMWVYHSTHCTHQAKDQLIKTKDRVEEYKRWMTLRRYEKVIYWLVLAIDSMVSLIYRLKFKWSRAILMDRYNCYLLGAVNDRVTIEEDISVET